METKSGKAKDKVDRDIHVSRQWFRMLVARNKLGALFSGRVAMRVRALEPSDRYQVTMGERTRLQYQSEFLDFWILLKKCEREIPQASAHE